MKTILICKGGSVWRPRASSNARGEMGETEGIIRHLMEKYGDDCRFVYYGAYQGEPPCEAIYPNLVGLDELSSHKDQVVNFETDADRLERFLPIVGFINVAGYAPTSSFVNNPMSAQVQAAAVRYTAPMLMALKTFGIPRIVVNTDPRTYPRDQEMTWDSDWIRPRALLDQWEDVRTWNKTVGGQRYTVKALPAMVQSWAHQLWNTNLNDGPPAIVQHAHVATGIKNGEQNAWQDILFDPPHDLCVYGEGWEKSKWYELKNVRFMGKVKADKVLEIFRSVRCSPVVSHTPGFLTGKPYVMYSQGCIPLLHRDYDRHGRIFPVEHPLRIKDSWMYKNTFNVLKRSDLTYGELMAEVQEYLQPDWAVLDALVEDLLQGKDLEDGRYGGFLKE